MKKLAEYTVLGCIVFLASMGITSWGQADTPNIAWKWTPPTAGSKVVQYQGIVRFITQVGDTAYLTVPGIAAPDSVLPTYQMDYQWGVAMQFRVAGVDSADRMGPYSEWSLLWTDAGPPGPTGTPEAYLVMVE